MSLTETLHHRFTKWVYQLRLKCGVAREQARKDLPLSNYTEAYWKVDLHNLFHFLSLRLDGHAQKEIREFASAIRFYVERWVPDAWEAFNDFRLQSVFLTGPEIQFLQGRDSKLSPREIDELKLKLERLDPESWYNSFNSLKELS